MLHFGDGLRQFVLDLHNELRNKVATGKEARGRQPPGADVRVLVRVCGSRARG